MDLPGVSVVVPVYQGEKCISECIDCLLNLDYPRDKLEILVVDNHSTDGTAEIVKSRPVRYVLETKRGACCARNAGWRAARFGLIAFTDSDCLVDGDWLKRLVPHFADPKTGGCGGRLVPTPPQTVVEEYVIYKDILSQERALRRNPISLPFLVTANAMYRRSVLEEVGGFDELFTVNGEDADLAWRVRWKNHQILYEPAAIVHHKHRSTLGSLLRQIKSYGAGSSYLFWKHHRRLGYSKRFVPGPYVELVQGFFLIPVKLLFGRGRLQRILPILDFLGALFFLSGKLSTSWRLRIRFY